MAAPRLSPPRVGPSARGALLVLVALLAVASLARTLWNDFLRASEAEAGRAHLGPTVLPASLAALPRPAAGGSLDRSRGGWAEGADRSSSGSIARAHVDARDTTPAHRHLNVGDEEDLDAFVVAPGGDENKSDGLAPSIPGEATGGGGGDAPLGSVAEGVGEMSPRAGGRPEDGIEAPEGTEAGAEDENGEVGDERKGAQQWMEEGEGVEPREGDAATSPLSVRAPGVHQPRLKKGAAMTPEVDPSLVPELVRDAAAKADAPKHVRCVHASLRTASPREAGFNWDKPTTTEDFFVHRVNRGPTSSMPENLLPPNADAVVSKMKWRTCALVGNSAVLLSGKPAGRDIDAHDTVVRLNQAPTHSYAARVGSKATWRILNKSWVIGYGGLLRREHGGVSRGDLPNEKGVHMLASRGNAQAVKKLLAQLATPRYRNNGVVGVRMNFKLYEVINNQLRRFRRCMQSEGTRFPGGATPSTGVMTALLLAGRCDELNLYGFGPPVIRGKYQYYTLRNSQRSSGASVHSFGTEYAFLRGLAAANRLTLCRPDNMGKPPCSRR